MAVYAGVSVPWQESGVWPESPQARAIRQAETPQPAMLTGACEFDVPLYTLSVGDVSLPLSLHYRSNGIRVDDDPQPVGYGWTLSPALRVSRQIMGRPDELFRPRGTDNIEDYETNFRSVVMDAEATNASMRDSLKRYDAEHDIYTVYLLNATLTLVRDWESGAFHGVGCGAIGRLARLSHGDAAVTEYAYDVHSWPVSQQTTYGTATNTSATARQTALGYTLEYAPCFNGNISKRVWDEGSYTYTYDALNRLTSAVFTPAEGLADRPAVERNRVPDFSVYYDYDLRGNTTNIVRYGVVDAVSDFDRIETFGTLDELACSYEGNQMRGISAITEALPFDGVTGLHADGEFELAYNDAGDMMSDASRGLLYTRWNADGHPMQYDIEGGHRHYLYWDGLGNHLYTSYEMAVAPVSAGSLPGRTRRTSIRAYSGDGHALRVRH